MNARSISAVTAPLSRFSQRSQAVFAYALLIALVTAAALISAPLAQAQEETILHSFGAKGTYGAGPAASLTFDAAGNLYGTTLTGGRGVCGSAPPLGCGTVFELIADSGGGWTQKVLHSFNDNGKDGWYPASHLILDSVGNLYGTTENGGDHNGGTVFELSPAVGGGWTETILHDFGHGNDGIDPSGVIFDSAGNLYGATIGGGPDGAGTAFELSPSPTGWTEKILHNFIGGPNDGESPDNPLVFDAAGNLYGLTGGGGRYFENSGGTLFELSPNASHGWTEKILHNFGGGKDGSLPGGNLVFDASGNLYGATQTGGTYNAGMVFELTPVAGKGWSETTLHSFDNNGTDGAYASTGVILDNSGNLYGTTSNGGTYGSGAAFELSPATGGGWTESILHSFDNNSVDGTRPASGLIFDASGNLYGTTYAGGDGGGTVFQITR